MKYRTFQDLALFVEAFIFLHTSKLIILIIPFKKIAANLGKLNELQVQSSSNTQKVKSIYVAIQRAAKLSFHSSKCYDQALTARWMLGNRSIPSTIYFGLAKEGNGLSAHAWVKSGNYIVTGKPGMDNFTVVASFTHQALKR